MDNQSSPDTGNQAYFCCELKDYKLEANERVPLCGLVDNPCLLVVSVFGPANLRLSFQDSDSKNNVMIVLSQGQSRAFRVRGGNDIGDRASHAWFEQPYGDKGSVNFSVLRIPQMTDYRPFEMLLWKRVSNGLLSIYNKDDAHCGLDVILPGNRVPLAR